MAKSRRARGTALLLAIAMTLLLFIMGFAFLITTQTQTEIAVDTSVRFSVDAGVNAVIEQINFVLAEDLFDENGNFLAGDGGAAVGKIDTGEPFDYPSHNVLPGSDNIPGNDNDFVSVTSGPLHYKNNADPWLASAEPFVVDFKETPLIPADDDRGFLHISDIYGALTQSFRIGPGNTDADGDRISFRNLRATIIDQQMAAADGEKADADGDGVSDSRWVKIPNLTGPAGEDFYAAVRIIDNCAMINVNTAFEFDTTAPSTTTVGSPQLRDGSRLTDINLYGLARGADAPGNLQNYRFSGNPADIYHDEVAMSVFNPSSATTRASLFALDDEVELRSRFVIDNDFIVTPLENIWSDTFLPGGGYTKTTPYDNADPLSGWYGKAFSDPAATDFYNRRHLVTTYSFDRAVAPYPAKVVPGTPVMVNDNAMPAELSKAWNEWTEINPAVADPTLKGWFDASAPPRKNNWNYRPVPLNRVGLSGALDPTIEQLAAAIWLGLPDEAAIANLPQFSNLSFWSSAKAKEHLAYQIAVNLLDFVDVDDEVTEYPPSGSGLGPNTYYGFESGAEQLYISMIATARKDNGSAEQQEYAIELYNPGPGDVNLTNWTIEFDDSQPDINSSGTIPAGDSRILVSDSSAFFSGTPAYVITTPLTLSDGVTIQTRWTGSGTSYICDSLDGTSWTSLLPADDLEAPDVWEVDYARREPSKVGSSDTVVSSKVNGLTVLTPVWEKSLADWTMGSLSQYRNGTITIGAAGGLDFTNDNSGMILTTAELFRVMAMATTDESGIVTTLPEFWDSIYSDTDPTMNSLTPPASPTIDRTNTAGRLDAAFYTINGLLDPADDDSFYKIMQYVTVFAPFNDFDAASNPVDNDGDPRTTQADRTNDDVDQDGDGLDLPVSVYLARGMTQAQADAAALADTDPDENGSQYFEHRIAGRININTAPWFVIAQLPWIKDPCFVGMLGNSDDDYHQHKLAQAIVAYRDKTAFRDLDNSNLLVEPVSGEPIPNYGIPFQFDTPGRKDYLEWYGNFVSGTYIPGASGTDLPYKTRKYRMGLSPGDPDVREQLGFASIEELLNVTQDLDHDGLLYPGVSYDKEYDFRNLARDGVNENPIFPVTNRPFFFADSATDDLAERDALLQRISNLATVRSDTFTAYLLVRLGTAGPQKRVIALFDRSNVFQPTDRPKLVYLHTVPEVN